MNFVEFSDGTMVNLDHVVKFEPRLGRLSMDSKLEDGGSSDTRNISLSDDDVTALHQYLHKASIRLAPEDDFKW